MSLIDGDNEPPVNILIVEDSRTQAEMLKNTLEKHGYNTTVAENGRHALEIIDTVNPDAIISDVIMPVMDGYEFCRTLKNDERYRHIPVILLTMLTDRKDVIYAMVSGADSFITKPYQGEYIVSRLKKDLAMRKSLSGPVVQEPPLEITLSGKKFTVTHTRHQIIELLMSAYEAAVIQHEEVISAQKRLADSNEESNLYLDIITHDINNVNTGSLALTELLLMKISDTERPLAVRLLNSINQSIEIIGNVSTIRRLHERKEALTAVNLDDIIRNEIRRFQNTDIHYAGSTARILADTLIGQVFLNLIGNSIKFAGIKAEIHLSVKDLGDMVEVVVADNGPGILHEMKPMIFERFRRGKTAKTGKGLGLFIVRVLVESYGGKIWAEDAMPGHPEKGAAIHFTLKKAD